MVVDSIQHPSSKTAGRVRETYATLPSMPDLLVALDAFLQEHRRCGELETAVAEGIVWMAYRGCEAMIARPVNGDKPTYLA